MSTHKARDVLADILRNAGCNEDATLLGERGFWADVTGDLALKAMQAYANLRLDEAAKVARDIDVDALSAHAAQEAIATAIEKLKEQP